MFVLCSCVVVLFTIACAMDLRVCYVLVYAEPVYAYLLFGLPLPCVFWVIPVVNGRVCVLNGIVGAGSAVLCHRYSYRVIGRPMPCNSKIL